MRWNQPCRTNILRAMEKRVKAKKRKKWILKIKTIAWNRIPRQSGNILQGNRRWNPHKNLWKSTQKARINGPASTVWTSWWIQHLPKVVTNWFWVRGVFWASCWWRFERHRPVCCGLLLECPISACNLHSSPVNSDVIMWSIRQGKELIFLCS